MKKTLIYNATIVNEGRRFKGAVLIEGERIADIFEGDAFIQREQDAKLEKVDAEGALLLPGIIDTHVHFREPGLTHKADIAHESRAALAGGVTSVMDMPNVNPPTTTLERWQERMALGKKESRCNYAYYIGATNDASCLSPITPSLPLKLFMGSSTGNMLVDDRKTLLQLFRMVAVNRSPYPPLRGHATHQRTHGTGQTALGRRPIGGAPSLDSRPGGLLSLFLPRGRDGKGNRSQTPHCPHHHPTRTFTVGWKCNRRSLCASLVVLR